MLVNVAIQIFHVVMKQAMIESSGRAINDDMFMNFHVAHGTVLLLSAAFKPTLPPPEKSQLVKTSAAVAQASPQENHVESDVVSRD